MSNSYLEELEKIANQLTFEEPMNPDMQPIADEDEVAKVQATEPEVVIPNETLSAEELAIQNQILQGDEGVNPTPEEQAIAEDMAERTELENAVISEVIPQLSDEELEHVLVSKVASEMIGLGTIAKLVEYANGQSEYITDEMQKQASDMIEHMTSSEESFNEGMEQLASQLFESEEAKTELYSREGLQFTMEQLATLDGVGFDKQANEDPNALQKLKAFAGNAVNSTTSKLSEAIHSVRNLGAIGEELKSVSAQLGEQNRLVAEGTADTGMLRSLVEQEGALRSKQRLGLGTLGVGAAAVAGGALYGGKKLHDHLNQENPMEEKIAGVLPDTSWDGTLNVVTETENNGGIQKMSKQLVEDFLKVAGAAGLISIVNNEELDMELRKEASDAFDHIASLGNSAMTESLVKVAQEIYNAEELHEIVAGQHTEELMGKVAFFIDATESSNGELEKVANAGGVAAVKNVGNALKNAGENIANTIGKAKDAAEGAGREYVGTLKAHPGAMATQGAAGLAGGGLVGTMAGYNAINKPQEYDIEQTAADLEQAHLAKQAAVEVFEKADNFIRQYGHILNK